MKRAYKLVRWDMGEGNVLLPTGVYRFPILRTYVAPTGEVITKIPDDTIDLAMPNVSAVVELRDTLTEYIESRK